MKYEKFVIQAGTRSIKYLTDTWSSSKLVDNIDIALKFRDEDSAKKYLTEPCLKNKKVMVKKVTITYSVED